MAFWLIALGIVALVTFFVARPLLFQRSRVGVEETSEDIQVYRDQLHEVENDLFRGVLDEEEAKRTKIEISRRILDADKAVQKRAFSTDAGPGQSRMAAAIIVLVLFGGSFGTYVYLGASGAPDVPLENRKDEVASAQQIRPGQADAEARFGDTSGLVDEIEPAYKDLVAQLRLAAENRPNDLQGQELLAEHEARLGNFNAAWTAKSRVIALKGDAASDDDFTDQAELMIIAAGGYVSPEAEQVLATAIKRERTNPRARYYSGLDLAQNGRPDLAYRLWSELLVEGPSDAPWIAPIMSQINDVARLAGISTGPTADSEQSGEATAEEQQEMIFDMVLRLSQRLATEGGMASEWAQLIKAYGVLGETQKAASIWQEAQQVFAADSIALGELRKAAESAGVAE